MLVTLAMFIAFARGRMSVEIISLLTIAGIAVGLYFFPLPQGHGSLRPMRRASEPMGAGRARTPGSA